MWEKNGTVGGSQACLKIQVIRPPAGGADTMSWPSGVERETRASRASERMETGSHYVPHNTRKHARASH